MFTFETSDHNKAISVTTTASLGIDDPQIQLLNLALDSVNAVCPIASISFSVDTYTITLKDSRIYSVQMIPGNPPKFVFTSASAWNNAEQVLLPVLGHTINTLFLTCGLSALSVTYN